MKRVLRTVSWLALVGTILPSFLFLAGLVELSTSKWLLLGATVAWFVTAPLWMGRQAADSEAAI